MFGEAPTQGQKIQQIMDLVNVLSITNVPESIFSSESIKFSCYVLTQLSNWLMDLDCSKHVTNKKANFVEYQDITHFRKAELADKKVLDIHCVGTVALCHQMKNGKESQISLEAMLYVSETSG